MMYYYRIYVLFAPISKPGNSVMLLYLSHFILFNYLCFVIAAKKLPKNQDTRRGDGVNLRKAEASESKGSGCC